MLFVNSYPLTWRPLRRRSGSARRQLWQNFLADFFEVLGGVAPAIFEVEDDMVHTGRAQGSEETKHDVSTAAETEVDRLRWGIRVVSQIDVERLGKRFEHPGAGAATAVRQRAASSACCSRARG